MRGGLEGDLMSDLISVFFFLFSPSGHLDMQRPGVSVGSSDDMSPAINHFNRNHVPVKQQQCRAGEQTVLLIF